MGKGSFYIGNLTGSTGPVKSGFSLFFSSPSVSSVSSVVKFFYSKSLTCWHWLAVSKVKSMFRLFHCSLLTANCSFDWCVRPLRLGVLINSLFQRESAFYDAGFL